MPRTPVNSQQGSTGSNSSGGSRSTQTSGYQSESQTGYATDDGSFESQILRRATKERPANLRMTAIRDYAPCCNEELSVRKGQRVRVLYRNHDWVFAVTKHGSNGFVNSLLLQKIIIMILVYTKRYTFAITCRK